MSRGKITFVLAVFAVALGACGPSGDTSRGLEVPEAVASEGALNEAERAALAFMREEEKLARDVYRRLNALHPMFSNIAASEQSHMDAVAVLLARYGVGDPAAGRPEGAFANPELQALYDSLVAAGSPSTLEALKVGAEIEELDLRDLARLRASVAHTDVLATFDQLARGSRNHLRAFYDKLRASGVTYVPKYISEAELRSIVSSGTEKGPGATN